MKLRLLEPAFAVCKIPGPADADLSSPHTFLSVTEDEVSLVCEAGRVPARATAVERDFRCLKVEGPLDFSMVGVIAGISSILAEHGVSLFVISTYDTDYILLKADALDRAIRILSEKGYSL